MQYLAASMGFLLVYWPWNLCTPWPLASLLQLALWVGASGNSSWPFRWLLGSSISNVLGGTQMLFCAPWALVRRTSLAWLRNYMGRCLFSENIGLLVKSSPRRCKSGNSNAKQTFLRRFDILKSLSSSRGSANSIGSTFRRSPAVKTFRSEHFFFRPRNIILPGQPQSVVQMLQLFWLSVSQLDFTTWKASVPADV